MVSYSNLKELGWLPPREADELREALRPFADAVFNDNGDMTVTPASRDAYIRAYFVMRSDQQSENGANG